MPLVELILVLFAILAIATPFITSFCSEVQKTA